MLEEARRYGFLGPGPVQAHLDHASGFGEVMQCTLGPGQGTGGRAADLGSGAGVPGLPLALRFITWSWVLVDSSARRAGFLRDAIRTLGMEGRVRVVQERAEVVGRSLEYRGSFDLVVARSFGPPAVAAECAAPLLGTEGWAVVSEPPGGNPNRWPAEGLARVGMVPDAAIVAQGWAYQLLRQAELCSERYPRRTGVPTKRPLF